MKDVEREKRNKKKHGRGGFFPIALCQRSNNHFYFRACPFLGSLRASSLSISLTHDAAPVHRIKHQARKEKSFSSCLNCLLFVPPYFFTFFSSLSPVHLSYREKKSQARKEVKNGQARTKVTPRTKRSQHLRHGGES